jgi:hypothetical protein
VRTSVWTPGDLNSTPALGGNDWPTDGGIRPGGLTGVVEVREEEFRCECEWECEDRGVGLVAVFVTIVIISGRFSEEKELRHGSWGMERRYLWVFIMIV